MTVGHQMPFDRLIRVMDAWAGRSGRTDVFAQIGRGSYRPRSFESVAFLEPDAFDDRIRRASLVVGHAGTGTIIAALTAGKPILVLPRLASLGETRNEHQTATARRFESAGRVAAAYGDEDLLVKLDRAAIAPPPPIARSAAPELIDHIRRAAFAPPPMEPAGR